MTDSIEELPLDTLALLLDDAAGVLADDGRQNLPKILRAAALKLRECRDVLAWIDRYYANQDMSHMDFRVEAYSRVVAVTSKAEGK